MALGAQVMAHVALSWPSASERHAPFWREAHRLLRQRLNIVVWVPDPLDRERCARSLRRYAKNHDIGCIVKGRTPGYVLVAFL